MPKADLKKIAYLFGAGATHAELQNLDPDLIEKKDGLLIKDVSSRVIEKARRNKGYLKNVELVSGTSGSLDIELLISLIENSKICGWEDKTHRIKKLVQKDIERTLYKFPPRGFYLHKALLELHNKHAAQTKEELIALISLNYDDILDQAYRRYYGRPNYCFSLDTCANSPEPIPLLKLHGSFNWKSQKIRGRKRTIEIIPLGSTKTYLHAPYGVIWNRALEILIRCSALRVIGCSLRQNDFHLIDLLFKAHLERETAFDMEIISSPKTGAEIQGNYGFFPKIKTLLDLEEHLIPDREPPNPFKTWLKYKAIAMLGKGIKRTQYLSKVVR